MSHKKTVTFTEDTKDPPVAERCSCCGHRNIIPRIREMESCMECFNQTCSECYTSMFICIECEQELLDSEAVEQSPEDEEYQEFSDENEPNFIVGMIAAYF